ncbi:MAG: hypothetical protein ACLTY0_01160 [Lachnospiraceae bacterium]
MVEALRDYQPGKYGNGADCFAEIENLGRYKNVSATRALNPHFKEYDIDIWKDIIDVFAMKVLCLYKLSDTMEYAQYFEEVTPGQIYVMEVQEAERQRVFVLSVFPEFLLDYFGVKLWKTSVKHTRNQMSELECRKNWFQKS